jgi:hypothetical protein
MWLLIATFTVPDHMQDEVSALIDGKRPVPLWAIETRLLANI